MSDAVRIVTMQQFCRVNPVPMYVPVEDADIFDYNQLQRVRAELAQAFADGFTIANVAIGGNERVLLTTWTLRKSPLDAAARRENEQIVQRHSLALGDSSQRSANADPVRDAQLERMDLSQRTIKVQWPPVEGMTRYVDER